MPATNGDASALMTREQKYVVAEQMTYNVLYIPGSVPEATRYHLAPGGLGLVRSDWASSSGVITGRVSIDRYCQWEILGKRAMRIPFTAALTLEVEGAAPDSEVVAISSASNVVGVPRDAVKVSTLRVPAVKVRNSDGKLLHNTHQQEEEASLRDGSASTNFKKIVLLTFNNVNEAIQNRGQCRHRGCHIGFLEVGTVFESVRHTV